MELTLGWCLNLLGEVEGGGEVELKSCDEPHEAEVIGIRFLPGAADAPYPGASHVLGAAETECRSAFRDYVGAEVDGQSVLHMQVYRPNPESWATGYRRVICLVFAFRDGDELTRSVKGSLP